MATSIWCELVCAHCSVAIAGEWSTGAIPRASLKAEAKSKGAVFSFDEVFYSEEHRLAAQPKHIIAQLQEVKP